MVNNLLSQYNTVQNFNIKEYSKNSLKRELKIRNSKINPTIKKLLLNQLYTCILENYKYIKKSKIKTAFELLIKGYNKEEIIEKSIIKDIRNNEEYNFSFVESYLQKEGKKYFLKSMFQGEKKFDEILIYIMFFKLLKQCNSLNGKEIVKYFSDGSLLSNVMDYILKYKNIKVKDLLHDIKIDTELPDIINLEPLPDVFSETPKAHGINKKTKKKTKKKPQKKPKKKPKKKSMKQK